LPIYFGIKILLILYTGYKNASYTTSITNKINNPQENNFGDLGILGDITTTDLKEMGCKGED